MTPAAGGPVGFGHDGPEGGRAGYDQIAQGEAGLMSLSGPSLHERKRTGRGRVVRTSLLAAAVGVHAFQGTRATVAGEVPRSIGNHHPSIAPYGLFHTADAPVQIAVGSEALWRRFASVAGLDGEDARFAPTPSASHIATI